VVAEMADEVLVMYAGRAVEHGPTKELLTHPEMPYTWGLLSSVPDVGASTDSRLIPIPGNPPSLLDPPPGCAFHPRCVHRDKVPGRLCFTELPLLVQGNRGPDHLKRCHLANPEMIYVTEILPEIAPELVGQSGFGQDDSDRNDSGQNGSGQNDSDEQVSDPRPDENG
jgi:peptide/nickel transport system ATP-binding protein